MSKKKGQVGAGTALAGLLILSGATLLWLGGLPIYRSHVSLRWTKVEGKVLSSGVATHKGDHGHFFYTPEVTYAYELGGSRYFNSQLRFGQLNSGQEIARQAAGKYPRGRAVTVYCNPRDPAMSVLEPGANPGTWLTRDRPRRRSCSFISSVTITPFPIGARSTHKDTL